MKKAEMIIAVLAILALAMNLLLIPGGGRLTVLTFSALAFIYFYFGILLFNNIRLRNAFKKSSYAGISRPRKVGAIATGIALSMTAIGIMFRFQSWPGANVMLIDGSVALLIVTIVAVIKNSQNNSDYYTNIFKRLAFMGGLASLLIVIPPETWIELKYRNHPAYRDALKNAVEQPNNQGLWEKVNEEREKMNNESK